MDFFKVNPFIRIIILYILGIVVQFAFNPLVILPEVIFFVAPAAVIIQFVKLNYHNHYLKGIALSILIFLAGGYTTYQNQKQLVTVNENQTLAMGIIDDVPVFKNRYYKTQIEITALKEGTAWKKTKALVVAYIEPKPDSLSFKAGQQILFKTDFQSIKGQQNPFGFDYANYLLLNLITQSVYLKPADYEIINAKNQRLAHKALNLRTKIISIYKASGISGDNLAVLSALTLGYKSMIDESVRAAFTGAGAMHVLAVSGLHIGIIYLIFDFLLIYLNAFPALKRARYVLIILILWSYTFVTGLSPSVMRACIMFSFLLVGKLTNNRISIYNSLAASAFFILLFKPLLLFNIGFQLSYTAVLGIVIFHPYISNWFYFKYKILNGLWSLTAVSIAAQLATFPITVYYFNQFPLYFWLANTIVTFAAFAILIMAVILVAFSWISWATAILSFLINLVLSGNLLFLKWINTLPHAVIDGLSLHPLQSVLIYVIIITITLWLITKNTKLLLTGLSFLLISGLLKLYVFSTFKNPETFCVYQTKYESGIQWVNGSNSIWISSVNPKNSRMESLQYQGNLFWKIKKHANFDIAQIKDSIIQADFWYFNNGFFSTANVKGLILHSKSTIPLVPNDTLMLNYLIVTGNPPFSLNKIPQTIKFDLIIIDGSVPYWKVKQIINDKPAAPVHITTQQGAYIKLADG